MHIYFLAFNVDICHCSPENPTDYVGHSQSFIDNLKKLKLNQIKKINSKNTLLVVGLYLNFEIFTHTLSERH